VNQLARPRTLAISVPGWRDPRAPPETARAFRLGNEQRVCGPGDIVVIPGGVEHEAWFREDTEVIDFFAPPRDDYSAANRPI
jgi:hypothetical protein